MIVAVALTDFSSEIMNVPSVSNEKNNEADALSEQSHIEDM